ncbi:MAG: type II toxin-antitoxin system PemK/MazF family toxin [Luteibaculum sp.]
MKQGDIWYANLNPSLDSEQAGYSPLLILSGNLLNEHLAVIICCPLTTKIKNYKGNLVLKPSARNGLKQESELLIFHIRSVSKERLTKKVGRVSEEEVEFLKQSLQEILSY